MTAAFADFIQSNAEALTAGTLILCVGTLCLGIVFWVVVSLERAFDAADGGQG